MKSLFPSSKMLTTKFLQILAIAPVFASASCGYLRNVRDDFLDIGTLAVGAVPPVMPFSGKDGDGAKSVGFIPPAIGVYVEATDFWHFGALYKNTVDAEWDRRGLGVVADERTKLGFGPCHSVQIDQKPIYTNDYKSSGNELDGWREHMIALKDPIFDRSAKQMMFDGTTFARPMQPNSPKGSQPGLHRGWQDWETFSLELGISEPFFFHTGLYFRIGFDPSQVFDFVLCLIGIDLYQDNAYFYSTGALKYSNSEAAMDGDRK
jgi:hypothetical protein